MYEFNVESIPSGKYFVSGTAQKTLRAYLGSCLGIVIVDTVAQVGGLLHILLPEPLNKASVDEPEKYASTAIPLFLEALTGKGATFENMKAWIAGGSLVGHVSLMDLKLDIGGKSTEIAELYLALEKIKIEKFETGGYIFSQLSLDLSNFECTIEPILNSHTSLKNKDQEFVELDIERALQTIKPIPQIALKVIRMIHDKDVSIATIANEIRQDQVLTAKVLQLSNTEYIGAGEETKTVDRALVLLGDQRILFLTLSVFNEMFYQQPENGYSLIKGGLYKHSTGVAFLAEKLSLFTGKAEPDQAHTAGLLHDIGKTVLDQAMAADYPLFYRKMAGQFQSDVLRIEKEVFGFDHTEIGMQVAEKWSLPDGIKEVIAYHHQPYKAEKNPQIVHIVFLANILCNSYTTKHSFSIIYSEYLKDTFDILNLSIERITNFIDSIDWGKVEEIG